MELKQIQNKIIETAILDYENEEKYNILNPDLLEDIIFILKNSKGNQTYSKEQAQDSLKFFQCILEKRENFLNKIRKAKKEKEMDSLSLETVKDLNKAKKELLEQADSSLEDFFASNSDLEEVKWLKSMSYNEMDVMTLLQEEYDKFTSKTIDFETFTQKINTILEKTLLFTKIEEVEDFLKKIYKEEFELCIEDLQSIAKKYIEYINKEPIDINKITKYHNRLKEGKEKINEVKKWAKKINPSFSIETSFTEEEMNNNPVLTWYMEQQKITKETIIKKNENATRKNATLQEQAELTILLYTNESAEQIIAEEKRKEVGDINSLDINKPPKENITDPNYMKLKNDYENILDALNSKIIDYNKESPNLLTQEAAVLNDLKIGNYHNVNSFLKLNAYIESIEEQIMAMKAELAKIDCSSFHQFKHFITNDISTKMEVMVFSSQSIDIDTFANARKDTIDKLKEQYDQSTNEEEKMLLKEIIFAEQTIKARRIIEEQRNNLSFDGVSYIKKYENSITFQTTAKQEKVSKEEKSPIVVKNFRIKIKEKQSTSKEGFILRDVPPIQVGILDNKLRIEYSKELKKELTSAKYDMSLVSTQIKSEKEVKKSIEESGNNNIYSYDLTESQPSSFNLAIVFKDLISQKEIRKFILIKDGNITKQVLNDEEVEPKILAH